MTQGSVEKDSAENKANSNTRARQTSSSFQIHGTVPRLTAFQSVPNVAIGYCRTNLGLRRTCQEESRLNTHLCVCNGTKLHCRCMHIRFAHFMPVYQTHHMKDDRGRSFLEDIYSIMLASRKLLYTSYHYPTTLGQALVRAMVTKRVAVRILYPKHFTNLPFHSLVTAHVQSQSR